MRKKKKKQPEKPKRGRPSKIKTKRKPQPSDKLAFAITAASAVLSMRGVTVIVPSTDGRYKTVLRLIHSSAEESAIWEAVRPKEDGPIKVDRRNVMFRDKEVPKDLHKRFLEFKFGGHPTEPLEMFWRKLRENPDDNSKAMLYRFLNHNGHPITDEGDFIAYKKVKDNFKDCHTGTFDNSIGKTVSMDRNKVDANPQSTCSHGLHVATFGYASDFSSGVLLEVAVNPRDVVAVPVDYDGTKMRVSKYKVLRLASKPRIEMVVDSEIANAY